MKQTVLSLAFAVSFITVVLPASAQSGSLRDRALGAAKELMQTLKGRLQGAIEGKGVAGAIDVCSVDGVRIPAEIVAREEGMALRRVSLKNRNPRNAPDSFEEGQLRIMEADLASGMLRPYYENDIATKDGKNLYRLMMPIIAGDFCLNCHGPAADMDPEVLDKIRGIYPHDKATGYKAGQLRGAVSVILEKR